MLHILQNFQTRTDSLSCYHRSTDIQLGERNHTCMSTNRFTQFLTKGFLIVVPNKGSDPKSQWLCTRSNRRSGVHSVVVQCAFRDLTTDHTRRKCLSAKPVPQLVCLCSDLNVPRIKRTISGVIVAQGS